MALISKSPTPEELWQIFPEICFPDMSAPTLTVSDEMISVYDPDSQWVVQSDIVIAPGECNCAENKKRRKEAAKEPVYSPAKESSFGWNHLPDFFPGGFPRPGQGPFPGGPPPVPPLPPIIPVP